MKTKLKFIVLILLFASCRAKHEKPFIIIDKFPNSGNCANGYTRYAYEDANGYFNSFCETEHKYSIGDTIK